MSIPAQAYENVTAEELAEARRYAMEIVWSDEDDAFVVSFPDAPGVMTHGATREKAAAMGEDAIITWYTALKDAGLSIPRPTLTAREANVSASDHYDAHRIREIRLRLDVSQRVFADLLNVSLPTIRSWEQGWRVPDGASVRLLRIAEEHPEVLLEALGAPVKQKGGRIRATR
jgi:DNA-binding transcriptional regulator YiaG